VDQEGPEREGEIDAGVATARKGKKAWDGVQ
jgi:hypothetical protein